MKLGNNVRKCRFERGKMTQQELANEVGSVARNFSTFFC
jgi:hypothetical protein